MEKNTPAVWNTFWKKRPVTPADQYYFAYEEHSIRWQRIRSYMEKHFGSFHNLSVIEIGAGSGTYAALMAKQGARVSLMDYSSEALDRARAFFQLNNLSADYIQADLLDLQESFTQRFDVCISVGLAEHFKSSNRSRICKIHCDMVRQGGICIISVPYKYSPFYQIFKCSTQLLGIWQAGEEYPFSRQEFTKIFHNLQHQKIMFLYDSWYTAFNLINPIKIVKKLCGLNKLPSISSIKKEKGNFLDRYLAYSLVACIER
ncbi:MAG: methyltransferase domain-containing protein [Elusimicrobia bacterium]|nr:methyltransferase domain-containing protein [Elusimicrobiota bacterium]